METNITKSSEQKKKLTTISFVAILSAVVIGLLIFVLNSTTCTKCGTTIFGKGYYSTDAFWSESGAEKTLCDKCAAKEWAPFDYRNYAK